MLLRENKPRFAEKHKTKSFVKVRSSQGSSHFELSTTDASADKFQHSENRAMLHLVKSIWQIHIKKTVIRLFLIVWRCTRLSRRTRSHARKRWHGSERVQYLRACTATPACHLCVWCWLCGDWLQDVCSQSCCSNQEIVRLHRLKMCSSSGGCLWWPWGVRIFIVLATFEVCAQSQHSFSCLSRGKPAWAGCLQRLCILHVSQSILTTIKQRQKPQHQENKALHLKKSH